MNKRITVYVVVMVLLFVFTSCSSKRNDESERKDTDEQHNNENFELEDTPEPTNGFSAGKTDADGGEISERDLEMLLKKGSENKIKFNGVSYHTEYNGKDGVSITGVTTLNIITSDSVIDYTITEKDGTTTRVVIYRMLGSTYMYNPEDNIVMGMPSNATDSGMDIPLVPLVPEEPMSDEDISNGLEYLKVKGYEEVDGIDYLVLVREISPGRSHVLWIEKETGLLARQVIESEEGTMIFSGYLYFELVGDEFDFPEDAIVVG